MGTKWVSESPDQQVAVVCIRGSKKLEEAGLTMYKQFCFVLVIKMCRNDTKAAQFCRKKVKL